MASQSARLLLPGFGGEDARRERRAPIQATDWLVAKKLQDPVQHNRERCGSSGVFFHLAIEEDAICNGALVSRASGGFPSVQNYLRFAKVPLATIFSHLRPYRNELEARATSQEWYELQQPQMRYRQEFEKPKILFQEIATYQAFAFDTSCSYINNKVFMIPLEDHYLLGVLNSAVAWRFLNDICPKLHGGTLRMQSAYVSKLPIPTANDSQRAAVEALVQRCIKQPDNAEVDKEIECRVAALYGVKLQDVDNFAGVQVRGRRLRRAEG